MISSERFNGIRAFVQAADAGSFSAAAQQLGLSKSTVGKAVARLEQRLSLRLFHRTTRSLALTDEGHSFYASCVRALGELENAEAALATRQVEPAGRLRVSLPALFGARWVIPVLLELAQQYPALELEVSFTSRRIDFAEDGIDLAVRIGELDAGAQLTARCLGTQGLLICAAPAYLAKHGQPDSLSALDHHACIGHVQNGQIAPWHIHGLSGVPALLRIQSRLRLGHPEAVAAAARAGYGIAQLPGWLVADAIRAGALVSILSEHAGPGLPIHVVWPGSQAMPSRTRAAVDALMAQFLPYAPWEQSSSDGE